MEHLETPEPGTASAQAVELKDDKVQKHLDLGVADVFEAVSAYTPVFRLEVLEAALNRAAAEKAGYEVGLKLPLQSEQPEETTAQEQPAELSIDQQTQERLKAFFKNLDPKTKLAIVTFSEIQSLDGLSFQARQKDVKLIDEIWDDLQTTCLEKYHAEPDDVIAVAVGAIDKEDIWLAGIWEAVRMVLQNC